MGFELYPLENGRGHINEMIKDRVDMLSRKNWKGRDW